MSSGKQRKSKAKPKPNLSALSGKDEDDRDADGANEEFLSHLKTTEDYRETHSGEDADRQKHTRRRTAPHHTAAARYGKAFGKLDPKASTELRLGIVIALSVLVLILLAGLLVLAYNK